ncbi:MAG: hypothetical protein JSW00_19585 [Thermoplasmata archaeon]|nr:MAG: hypothetical protein JSW00_19585 [Thermoplasmata archaeon]
MNTKTLKITRILPLFLCLVVMLFPGLTLADGYDIIYYDSEGDVKDLYDDFVRGYQYLDIIEISSSESTMGVQLILTMTVEDVIMDSDKIFYSFTLMDGDEWSYMVSYSNGVCNGINMEDGSSDVLQATGSGTDTLEVRIQMNDIGEIIEFNFYGEAYEEDYVNDIYCYDRAPDEEPYWEEYYYGLPVMITDPRPGSTVSKTKIIKGETNCYGELISVEIQIDSTSDSGWELASTSNDWETWRFEWDTTSVSDDEHTIYARGYDGREYYEDSITVFVDQSNTNSPRTTDVPELKIGTELIYEIEFAEFNELEDIVEYMDFSADISMEVTKIETIDIDGEKYDAYAIDMSMTLSFTLTFDGETMSSSATGEGKQWLRVSDLATIKGDMKTEMTYSAFDSTETRVEESTVTYDPPLDNHDFPISIAETWTSTSTVSTITDVTVIIDGEIEEEYQETDSSSSITEYEALHVKEVTVGAGTFETFVIWSMEGGEYFGGDLPLFGTGSGYTLVYYSPELGFPVKTEAYSDSRELQVTMELVSYKGGRSSNPISSSQDSDLPIYLFLIPIMVIIILVSVLVATRRQRPTYELGSGQGYPAQTAHVSPPIPVSRPYTSSYPSTYPSHPYQSQPQMTPQIQGAYPVQVNAPISPPPPQVTQIVQLTQPVIPQMQVKCPSCYQFLFVPSNAAWVQCPFCYTRGRIG